MVSGHQEWEMLEGHPYRDVCWESEWVSFSKRFLSAFYRGPEPGAEEQSWKNNVKSSYLRAERGKRDGLALRGEKWKLSVQPGEELRLPLPFLVLQGPRSGWISCKGRGTTLASPAFSMYWYRRLNVLSHSPCKIEMLLLGRARCLKLLEGHVNEQVGTWVNWWSWMRKHWRH